MNTRVFYRTPPAARAFSLIELIGVMAVMAILTLAIVPSIMLQMRKAALTREISDLAMIAGAFTNNVLRTRSIPSHTTWAVAISDDLAKAPANISTNRAGLARAFLIDPALSLGGATLPYVQTTNGTAAPISPRVMFVASVGAALPVNSGVPTSAAFNDIWSTDSGTIPSTWTNWAGRGEDVVIQRVNLAPLFHRLILINGDSAAVGRFSLFGSTPLSVPTNGLGWSTYYLTGTVLGLHGANGDLQTREILKRDISYVFECGYWRSQVGYGALPPSRSQQFVTAIGQFLASTRNPSATNGASPQSVVDQSYSYLFAYASWAGDTPCFSRSGAPSLPTVPQYVELDGAQKNLSKVTKDLIK